RPVPPFQARGDAVSSLDLNATPTYNSTLKVYSVCAKALRCGPQDGPALATRTGTAASRATKRDDGLRRLPRSSQTDSDSSTAIRVTAACDDPVPTHRSFPMNVSMCGSRVENRRRLSVGPWLVLSLALSALPWQGRAQTLYGSLTGNVTDQSGAAVPNA